MTSHSRLAKSVSILLLLGAAAVPAVSANLVGLDYSEWLGATTQIATDTAGSLYLLMQCPLSQPTALTDWTSCVTKLSADGKTMLWQNVLAFQASTMAVSASGDVFLIPKPQPPDTSIDVVKLGTGGSGIAWQAEAVQSPTAPASFVPLLAVDPQGRTYVAAFTSGGAAVVVRLNAAGAAVDYTASVAGTPTSIAADGTGAVVVAGQPPTGTSVFVMRVAPDGSTGYNTVLPLPQAGWPVLALDSAGNAVMYDGAGVLRRFNSTGAVTVSTSVPGVGAFTQLVLDAAGNAYVTGISGQVYPVRNTIAPCLPGTLPDYAVDERRPVTLGTAPLLTVVAPDGSIPQSTYLPGAAWGYISNTLLLAAGPNSSIFVATTPSAGFVPTGDGPFQAPAAGPPNGMILLHLSSQTAPAVVSLACVGSAATYFVWPVAPGEMVTLFGNGLGPQQGIATQATAQSPFPVQVSGVNVTFDGTPAPLLWVQDSQINVIAPWSLTPGQNTKICVSSAGATGVNCRTWPVVRVAPGVFSPDGVHAAAVNQDGTVNSPTNPAAPGSVVSVFATGLGPINPPQADGTLVEFPLPANDLSAGVDAMWLSPPFNRPVTAPLSVSYAGPAPTLVAGVTQINFQIPPPNGAVPAAAALFLSLPPTASQIFYVYVAGQ